MIFLFFVIIYRKCLGVIYKVDLTERKLRYLIDILLDKYKNADKL